MVKKSSDQLQGMKEICSYVNRSEATVLSWIRSRAFPASKVGGGIWESDKTEVDQWRKDQVAGRPLPELGNRKKDKENSKPIYQ